MLERLAPYFESRIRKNTKVTGNVVIVLTEIIVGREN